MYESGSTTPIYSEEMKDIEAGYVYTAQPSSKIVIPADKDLYLVYKATLPANKSAMIIDAGPAVAGYGDLISSSGSNGYWYSLADKYGQDYNWLIEAVLKKPDSKVASKAKRTSDAVTYNVYCNGKSVATGLATTEYAVEKGAYGRYTVTAVTGGVESAESNAVNYNNATGINGVEDGKAASVSGVFTIDGKLINDNGVTEGLKKGIHIVNGKKIMTK